MMESSTSSTFKLPACERCRKNKIKCDAAVPKCSACTKSASACIIVDTSTGDRYGREQLHEMQQRLDDLELARTQSETIISRTELSSISPASPSVQRTHFVGDGSGIDMFHRVSTNVDAAETRARIFEQLNIQSPRNTFSVPDHHLPTFDVANTLIERYCSHAHLLHPLMTKSSLRNTLHRVYQSNNENTSQQDLYTIFMISAISSVTMFRKGTIGEHPYGFYRSASRLLPYIPLVGTLQAVQNLLLIARFAMYYHIECSIWDITRLCMRECIELGLHQPPTKSLPAMEEQLRRNVFWDCYVHDRYSSGILGRPFAIAEEDIAVDLPIEASEDQFIACGWSTVNHIPSDSLIIPSEASIFRFVIRLRRITARCQAHFFSPKRLSACQSRHISLVGEILNDLHGFLNELELCQQCAPAFLNPQTLYERLEWHQFMVEKDKLTVIRGAFANLSACGSHLPQNLLLMCLNSASRVIELYLDLFSTGAITWTRSYFQILFTSGLSVIYALSQLKISSNGVQGSNQERSSQALRSCSQLLFQFISEMPDAGRFAAVFEALSKPYMTEEPHHNSQGFTNQIDPSSADVAAENFETSLHDERETIPYQHPHISVSGLQTGYSQYDFEAFEVELANLEDWSLFPTTSSNFLGQMEAGIGQYAWGTQHDANAWHHYISG